MKLPDAQTNDRETEAVDQRIRAALSGKVGAFDLSATFDAPLSGVTALFGPSGSGKTTVLRALAGLTRLDGRLRVGEAVWQDDATGVFVAPHARPIGYVFQDARLFPHLDVRANLMFGAKRARDVGSRHANQSHDFDRLIDLLAIEPLLDRSVAKLSGGEQQRVSIGRALLSQPRVLLMDEPLSAVDRTTKDEVLPYIERLSDSFGVPVIYVSHDISEVSRLADWMVLMSPGRVTAQGPLDEMLARLDLNRQTGRFEAGVIINATLTSVDRTYQIATLNFEGETLLVPALDAPVGTEVRLRIRARDVAIAIEAPSELSIRNAIKGRITSLIAEPDSAFAELLIAIGGQSLRARLTRHAVDALQLVEGQAVYALVKSVAFDGRATLTPPSRPE